LYYQGEKYVVDVFAFIGAHVNDDKLAAMILNGGLGKNYN
jgi:hypothetical protein